MQTLRTLKASAPPPNEQQSYSPGELAGCFHFSLADNPRSHPLTPHNSDVFCRAQRLREELKEIALKRCDESVAKFAACAREKGMMVVFSCREQNALSESSQFVPQGRRKEKKKGARLVD